MNREGPDQQDRSRWWATVVQDPWTGWREGVAWEGSPKWQTHGKRKMESQGPSWLAQTGLWAGATRQLLVARSQFTGAEAETQGNWPGSQANGQWSRDTSLIQGPALSCPAIQGRVNDRKEKRMKGC